MSTASAIMCVVTRYMKWQLKDGVGLVVRCEYDAVLPPPSRPTYISIKALNEWDSKVYTCTVCVYKHRTQLSRQGKHSIYVLPQVDF